MGIITNYYSRIPRGQYGNITTERLNLPKKPNHKLPTLNPPLTFKAVTHSQETTITDQQHSTVMNDPLVED
ncbi:hypothetical protein Hanom_Chr06g00550131 [Helianthus anomalus]